MNADQIGTETDTGAGADPGEAETIAFFNALSAGTLAGRMGIVITGASPKRVVGTMPVQGNTQAAGILHGGASVVLAETLGSLSSALHTGDTRDIVGVDINATHLRAARQGIVTGVATPIHVGADLAVHEVVITDQTGRRVCTCRITCLIKK